MVTHDTAWCLDKLSSDSESFHSFPLPSLSLKPYIGFSSLICFLFFPIIHVFYYHLFVSPFLICASEHYFPIRPSVHFLICTCWHHLYSLFVSLHLSPITRNNHTHFHILPSAVSPRRPWAAGCWLASVLMNWRSRTQHLELMDSVARLRGASTHTRPHTQMPRLVIDGQLESQPLQT